MNQNMPNAPGVDPNWQPSKLQKPPKGVNWTDYYGLVPVGGSLVDREKEVAEVGEDCGLVSDRK